MRIRAILPAVLAGAALFASTATAAPAVVITDPSGDAKGGQAAYDIVSVTFETTRTSKAKNAPFKDFVVTMELAAPPSVRPGTSYQIGGENAACGTFFAYVYWSAEEAGEASRFFFAECDAPDALGLTTFDVNPVVSVKGNKLVFTSPAKALPSQLKAGSLFSDVFAYTAVTEPTSGYSTMDFQDLLGDHAEHGTLDVGRSATTYKYGA